MTADEKLDLLDDAAVRLCKGYASHDLIGFVVRTMEDGSLRMIGPALLGRRGG